jgi:uncharacterized membrane protein
MKWLAIPAVCLSSALLVLVVSLSFAMPVQAFCVSLTPSSNTVNIDPGGQATVQVSVSTTVNFDYGTETFSLTGAPQGVSGTFNPSTIPYSGGYSGMSTLTLTADNITQAGTYSVTIHLIGNGPDSGQGNTASISLAVSSTPVPEFPMTTASILVAILIPMTLALVATKRRK